MIELQSNLETDDKGNSTMIFKVAFDKTVFENLDLANEFSAINREIVKRLADELMPKFQEKMMSDPNFMQKVENALYLHMTSKLMEQLHKKDDN